MAAAGVPPPVLFQGIDKGSFGYKLLAAQGWREGEGLVRQLVFSPAEGRAL